MIPEDKVRDIRERSDLVAVVSEYVSLRRSGASFKGLCPFHQENTPSFYVHPDRGFFHCFGCGASGDVIAFLMRIEGLPFTDVMRQLAEQAGVELTFAKGPEDREAQQARARRDRLLSLVEEASAFFVRELERSPEVSAARTELDHRGVSAETAARYRLGVAPNRWDALAGHLSARGYSPVDCERVGLVIPRQKGRGVYDRFRHRLMFPITDPKGRVIAFSGRALPLPEGEGDNQGPKYINSSEGPLFSKGEVLYGLHEARLEARRRDQMIVCEGNFDVLALAQAGFPNVVAPLGTALTEAQARLLRRFAARVVLMFDGDAAGTKAVRAAYPHLRDAGLFVSVAQLPPGQDPDSLIRSRGAETIARLLEGASGILEWMIDAAANDHDGTARAKAMAIESLGSVLRAVDNPVEARLYLERIARAFELRDVATVRRQLLRGAREPRSSTNSVAPREVERDKKASRLPPLEADLVGVFLDHPSLAKSDCAEKVQEFLTSESLRAIFLATVRFVDSRGVDASALLAEFGASPARTWLEGRLAVQHFQTVGDAESFLRRTLPVLQRRGALAQQRRLNREILLARRAGDDARAEALTRQMSEVFRRAGRVGTEGT